MKLPKNLLVGVLALGAVSATANWVITVPETTNPTLGTNEGSALSYNPDVAGLTIFSVNLAETADTNLALASMDPAGPTASNPGVCFIAVSEPAAPAPTVPFAVSPDWSLASPEFNRTFLTTTETPAPVLDTDDALDPIAGLARLQHPERARTLAGAMLLGFGGLVLSRRRLFGSNPARADTQIS